MSAASKATRSSLAVRESSARTGRPTHPTSCGAELVGGPRNEPSRIAVACKPDSGRELLAGLGVPVSPAERGA